MTSGNPPAGGLVDVHTHAIDPDLADLSAAYPGDWPTVRRQGEDRATVYLGTRRYRDIDERCWSAARRLRDMDADGVEVQVLSPMPASLMHDADPAGAAELARRQNDFLAGLVATAPDRFRAFGAVPLQSPELAVAEFARCIGELGFVGVEIGTRVGERNLSDPGLDPFFAAAAGLRALIFVHPVDRDVDARLGPARLDFGVGMPVETGAAAAMLLTAEVAGRRPGVRLCLAHAGGVLPYLLPRIDRGERLWARDAATVMSDRLRSVYCDSLTYDVGNLATVIDRYGRSQVLLGTDYPFPARERPTGRCLSSPGQFSAETVAAVGRENALRVFGEVLQKGVSWVQSSASA
jgi:aminocarboxymuconate-semialdehyde decarboxylase